MFPELPDASMETRKPIASPSIEYEAKQFEIIAERTNRVNGPKNTVEEEYPIGSALPPSQCVDRQDVQSGRTPHCTRTGQLVF